MSVTAMAFKPQAPDALRAPARLAAHFGERIDAELKFDGRVSTILEGEQYTPDDYYWLARLAGHHGLKVLRPLWALQDQLCTRCEALLFSADEKVSGLCEPCILDLTGGGR